MPPIKEEVEEEESVYHNVFYYLLQLKFEWKEYHHIQENTRQV